MGEKPSRRAAPVLIWLKRLFRRLRKKRVLEPVKKQLHRRSRYRGVSRVEFEFSTSCALVDPPMHPVCVLLINHVVKAIDTPCDLSTGAAVSKLSHAATCAEPCTQIKARLARHGSLSDPLSGNLFEAVGRADQKRIAHAPAPRPTRFRYSPSLWAAFLARVSPLPVRVSTSRFGHSVWVETPFAHSEYTFTGGVWALALGPGDSRVYRLLTKYLYEVPGDPIAHKHWEPQETFQADATWPYGEEPLPNDGTKR